jgi:CheY-like chemotaxis protein
MPDPAQTRASPPWSTGPRSSAAGRQPGPLVSTNHDIPAALQLSAPRANRVPRVLVVDDERGVREMLQEAVSVFGYDVVTAAHGAEALELFLRDPCDLVITDLMMPGMSGWELSAHLRAADPRLPIVILTGFGANLEDEAHQRGIVLMHKPVRLEVLAATLGEALTARGRR